MKRLLNFFRKNLQARFKRFNNVLRTDIYYIHAADVVIAWSDEVRKEETVHAGEDQEVRRGGRRTYRVPDGLPDWAQPVELILPIISPREVSGGVEVDEAPAIHSAHAIRSCENTDFSRELNVATIVFDPPIQQLPCAEVAVVSPRSEVSVVDPPTYVIRQSTNEDYESAYSGGADFDASVQNTATDPSIRHCDAADYRMSNPPNAFFVPLDSDPQIQEYQVAAEAVQSAAIPRIQTSIPVANQRRSWKIKHDGRLNEDPWKMRRSHTYNIKPLPPTQNDFRQRGVPLTRGRQNPQSSIHTTTSSGSGRSSSYDSRQTKTGGNWARSAVENRSANRVNVTKESSNVNCRKWTSDRTADVAVAKSDRKSDRRGQSEVNRKYFNAGSSNLMTSSVTTVLSARSYSVHGARFSASLGTQRAMTSAKPKPEPETQRRQSSAQDRVKL